MVKKIFIVTESLDVTFSQLVSQIDSSLTLLSVRQLKGGVSAVVHALKLRDTDGTQRTIVVRQQGEAAWKLQDEQNVTMQYTLLRTLFKAGLPVPEPLLLDTTEQLFNTPFLVMTFVEGSADIASGDLQRCLPVIAEILGRLHNQPTADLRELPIRTDPLPELLEYIPELPAWRSLHDHLSQRRDLDFQGRPVLLHGDFGPGNLLWREQQLVAVLDWEDAILGDPMSDVAGCRLELLWKYGWSAMDQFTQAYTQALPLDLQRLTIWELIAGCSSVRLMSKWSLEPHIESDMHRKSIAFAQSAARRFVAPENALEETTEDRTSPD